MHFSGTVIAAVGYVQRSAPICRVFVSLRSSNSLSGEKVITHSRQWRIQRNAVIADRSRRFRLPPPFLPACPRSYLAPLFLLVSIFFHRASHYRARHSVLFSSISQLSLLIKSACQINKSILTRCLLTSLD